MCPCMGQNPRALAKDKIAIMNGTFILLKMTPDAY